MSQPLTIQEVAEAIGMMCNVKARWSPVDRRVIVDFPPERGGRARMTSTRARKFLTMKMASLPAGVAPGSVIGPRQTPSAGYVLPVVRETYGEMRKRIHDESERERIVKSMAAYNAPVKKTPRIIINTGAGGTTAKVTTCERCADDNALGIQEPNHAAH